MPEPRVLVLHARGVLDVDSGKIMDFGYVRVEGNRISGSSRLMFSPDASERCYTRSLFVREVRLICDDKKQEAAQALCSP